MLSFEGYPCFTERPQPSATKFLALRWKCLQSLYLRNIPFEDTEMVALVQRLPQTLKKTQGLRPLSPLRVLGLGSRAPSGIDVTRGDGVPEPSRSGICAYSDLSRGLKKGGDQSIHSSPWGGESVAGHRQ